MYSSTYRARRWTVVTGHLCVLYFHRSMHGHIIHMAFGKFTVYVLLTLQPDSSHGFLDNATL